jgi:antitoxin (DNA-binding transcriptional repressor) of toxin-antitoxin stability system
MPTYIDVGAYDAKKNFSAFLRQARAGMIIRITNRGQYVADLVPPGTDLSCNQIKAAERMQLFMQNKQVAAFVNIKSLIEEGRD